MINAIIVDDESCFREMIQFYLSDYFPEIKVIAQADNVVDAVRLIDENKPELVFLDIEIKGGTGFHVLQKLKKRDFKLIFITAFNDFAIQAIKFSAIDYILKPINEFEFKAGVEQALQEIQKEVTSVPIDLLIGNSQEKSDKKLVLRTAQEIHIVNVSEIIRCEADNVYTTFHIDSGEKIIVSKGLTEYVDLLESYGFLRPHQSHLINLNFVKKLDKSDGGVIVLKNNTVIPVSSRRKQAIMDVLNKL
ncbi:MAG TPA: LytTR family DNA-binding domain-containing protein [Prolixibacteraceae bacterium]|nr:LytTR family DNA-binding domain-containing protein [Prolixibacteraceae bacterium]